MNLRALRYFISVAQLGSISGASQMLNVAQPALSRQIKQLEDELGVTLVERRPRGVEVTPEGALLLERAKSIVQILQDTSDELRNLVSAPAGRLVIGVPPATGLMLVGSLVRQFRARYPHVLLRIIEGVGSSLVEWVLDERVDLAIVHNPPRQSDLEIESLISERMVCVLPPEMAETNWERPSASEISLREISALPLILPSLPHTNRLLLDSMTARTGEYLRPILEVDGVAITKGLVADGIGATILTYAAVHEDVVAGRLSALPIGRPPLISTLTVAYLRGQSRPKHFVGMTEIIRTSLSEIVRSGTWQGAMQKSSILQPPPLLSNGR